MKKALLIVDMQNDFVTGTLGNKECQQVVAEVVDILENSDDYILDFPIEINGSIETVSMPRLLAMSV